MKRYYILLLLTVIHFFNSCSTIKQGMVKKGDTNDAVMNAIIDFSKTGSIYKNETIFYISIKKINEDKLVVDISKNSSKILIGKRTVIGSKGKTPSRYIEKDGKLFFWWDDNFALSQDALDIFSKYKLTQFDEDGAVLLPDNVNDEKQKGFHYYFCLCNLLNYKKVITTKGLGYYDSPNLECDCD